MQLMNTKTTELVPEDSVFLATDTLGKSTRDALYAANEWLTKTAEREPGKVDVMRAKLIQTERSGFVV
jgi:hypothetical protein